MLDLNHHRARSGDDLAHLGADPLRDGVVVFGVGRHPGAGIGHDPARTIPQVAGLGTNVLAGMATGTQDPIPRQGAAAPAAVGIEQKHQAGTDCGAGQK